MPYLRGKLKGELKSSEIRKIVRLHNELSKIKIPPRLDRTGLIKFIESKGYKIDHDNQKIVNNNKVKKDLTLKEAQEKFPTKPRKKKETKKEEKKEKVLELEDANKDVQDLKDKRCSEAVAHAESIIRFYEKYNGVLKNFPDYKSKKEMNEDFKQLKNGKWGSCTQEEQEKIRKAIKLHENPPKKKGKVKKAVEKIEEKEKEEVKVNKALRKRQNKEIKQKYNMGGMDKILELDDLFSSTPSEIKSKCRKLQLKYHPDKPEGDEERFKAIKESCDMMMKSFRK